MAQSAQGIVREITVRIASYKIGKSLPRLKRLTAGAQRFGSDESRLLLCMGRCTAEVWTYLWHGKVGRKRGSEGRRGAEGKDGTG